MSEYLHLKRCSSCGTRSENSLCSPCKTKVIEAQRKRLNAKPSITTASNDRAFYNSVFWDRLRTAQLHNFPYCQHKLDDGRLCYVTHRLEVDHITPRSQGGPDNHTNLQTLCHDHHIAKTNRENGVFNQHCEVIVVCGPPGAGKTHYIQQHWQRGDLIIDLDRIVPALTLDAYIQEPQHLLKFAWSMRDAAIKHAVRAANYARLWIAETAPSRTRRDYLRLTLNAHIIVLTTTRARCIANTNQQSTGRKSIDWAPLIDDWFKQYTPAPGDELIDPFAN